MTLLMPHTSARTPHCIRREPQILPIMVIVSNATLIYQYAILNNATVVKKRNYIGLADTALPSHRRLCTLLTKAQEWVVLREFIEHRQISTEYSQTNGVVERCDSLMDLKQMRTNCQRVCNRQISPCTLNHIRPIRAPNEWLKKQHNSFLKPGCNVTNLGTLICQIISNQGLEQNPPLPHKRMLDLGSSEQATGKSVDVAADTMSRHYMTRYLFFNGKYRM